MIKLQQILYPIDFSERSLHALETALRLATKYDAELSLLQTVESPSQEFAIPLLNSPYKQHRSAASPARQYC